MSSHVQPRRHDRSDALRLDQDRGLAVAPLVAQPFRWAAITAVTGYYHTTYRIRGWGRLPPHREATVIVANHQHEVESAVIVSMLSFMSWSWRYPIFTASSRRMWEPGFLAERLPWLSPFLRNVNLGTMFSILGLQPIENELHSRPFVSIAYALHQRHGDVPAAEIFLERAIQRLPREVRMLGDLLSPKHFHVGRTMVTLSELREPYRREILDLTREQLEADLAHFEKLTRSGATIFLTPEGTYSGDGKMQRLRGVLSRLAPLAQKWLSGISYDPFVGRRLSLLYRVVPAVDDVPLDLQVKRTRPITTSALLATWLRDAQAFREQEAIDAVMLQLAELPRSLFVDPELRRDPAHLVRRALRRMIGLGALRISGERYELSDRRVHPQFPRTADMVEYQCNFHQETLEGARA